mgnify:CR=1 FL=1
MRIAIVDDMAQERQLLRQRLVAVAAPRCRWFLPECIGPAGESGPEFPPSAGRHPSGHRALPGNAWPAPESPPGHGRWRWWRR